MAPSIDRHTIERMYAELQAQYINATRELEQARANANAIKGAMQFAERLLREEPPVLPPLETAGQPQLEPVECLKTAHAEGEPDA